MTSFFDALARRLCSGSGVSTPERILELLHSFLRGRLLPMADALHVAHDQSADVAELSRGNWGWKTPGGGVIAHQSCGAGVHGVWIDAVSL